MHMHSYTPYPTPSSAVLLNQSCADLLYAGPKLLSSVINMWLSAGIRWRVAGVQGELVPCTFNFAPSWTVRHCRSSGIKSAQLAVPEPLRNLNAALRCDEAL